jgi:hypothetical protein
MRKIVILAGLLMGAALFSGTPAKAYVSCECFKIGAAPVCTATVDSCLFGRGGVCLAPCNYVPPPVHHRRHSPHKKKM